MNLRKLLKCLAALTLTTAAVWVVAHNVKRFCHSGEEDATVWFYDQTSKRLYKAQRNTVPPDKANGVRAAVVCFRGEENDPGKRRIAYLETYAPALKEVLKEAHATHVSKTDVMAPVPSRESEFFQTNDLVKRASGFDWHPRNSPEGQKITTEWKSWRDAAGQMPIACQ